MTKLKNKLLTILFLIFSVLCCCFAFGLMGCTLNCEGNKSANTEQTGSDGGTISGGDENCEHKWSSWTIVSSATCTEKGKQERSCSVCGGKETKEIPALGHSFNTSNICTKCGFELTPTVGLEYKEFTRNDKTYEMVIGMGTATDTDLVIPAYHAGKAVRKIDDYAFNGKDALKSVYIANGVQEIGEKAFAYCTSLTKIELPESLSEDVYELVRVPDVGYLAHRRVYIPNLGIQAFYGCTKLSEIIMPEKGLRIAANVFDSTAYYNNANNWDNNVLFVQNHLIVANSNFDSEIYNLNANIVSIADKAFDGKSCLKEFNVPLSNSLQRMADNALSNSSIINAETPYDFLSYLPAQNIKKLKVNCSKTIYNLQQFVNVEELNVNGDWVDTSYWSSGEVPPLQGMGKLKKLTIKWIGGKGHRKYTLGQLFGEDEYPGGVAIKQCTGKASGSLVYDTLYVPSNLNEVTVLSGGITSYAFQEMSSISKINLGSDVNSLGDNICYHCNEQVVVNFANETEFLSTTKTASSYVVSDSRLNKYAKLAIDNKDIVDFKIPDGTTNIKECAFINCAELKEATIPSSVTTIGSRAFSGCTSLESVTIPDGVTSINIATFSGCSNLEKVTIPNSVTSIENNAFYGCSGLTNITIPASVATIGDSSFYNCTTLGNITIADNVTSIGSKAFSNTAYYDSESNWNNDVLYIGNYLLEAKTTISGSYAIKENTVYIANSAFKYCSQLLNLTIPDSVTIISANAFYGCSSLTSVTIPNGVTKINEYAFYGCSSLTSATIPDSVTSIENYSFYECKNLTNLIIPDSVTTIGNYAFYNCSRLTSIKVGKNVASIYSNAFYNCNKLVEVYNISSLTFTAGSSNYGYIGYYALNIYTPTDGNSKTTTTSDGYIFYEDGEDVYLIDYNGVAAEINLPSNYHSKIYKIYQNAFRNNTTIIKVIIPQNVTAIGASAFYECTNLVAIDLGGATSIGTSCFYKCTSLKEIIIPEGTTEISAACFESCSELETVVLPKGLLRIGADAFFSCSKLKNIVLPESLTYIGGSRYSSGGDSMRFGREHFAFYGCACIEEDEGLYYIGNWLVGCNEWYDRCPENAVIRDGTIGIVTNAFYNSPIKTIYIPKSVKYIEGSFVGNCYVGQTCPVTRITYGGTIADWNLIELATGWNRSNVTVVHCSNGNVYF